MLSSVSADIRYAARSLSKVPAFATVAILTLAIGIGANVAIVSLYQQILFQPLPVTTRSNRFTSNSYGCASALVIGPVAQSPQRLIRRVAGNLAPILAVN